MDLIDRQLLKIKELHNKLRMYHNMPLDTRMKIIKKLQNVYAKYINAMLESDEITAAAFFTCIDILTDNIEFLKEKTFIFKNN